jgi:LacI family transcriptional regulator
LSGSVSRSRDVTVADVAKRAKVGKSTASRALGGYGSVSPDVRDRVLSAADELGYRPNELARSMNTGRSRTIGVIVGDIENPYFSVAMRGISDTAKASGYDVILANTSEDLEAEQHAVRVFLDKRVDAMIVAPSTAYQFGHLREVQHLKRPLVLLDRNIHDLDAAAIQVAIAPAASEATDLLLGLGHRRIAFISALITDGDRFAQVQTGVSSVSERLTGVVDALRSHDIEPDPALMRFKADSETATARIIDELMALDEPPTAIIASDSNVAMSVLLALRSRSIAVPGQMSLIAFDDAPWARISNPPLTAITHPIYEAGAAAARTALRLIDHLPPPEFELAARLTLRDSHGVPTSGPKPNGARK